jgi:hypothetical protein
MVLFCKRYVLFICDRLITICKRKMYDAILYVSSYYFFCFLFSHLKMWTTNASILNSYLIHTQAWFVIAVCGYFSSWRWIFNWLYDEKLGEQGHRCKLLSCNLASHLILIFAALFTPVCSLSRLGPDIHLRRRKPVPENIRCYFFVKLCLIFKSFLSAFFQPRENSSYHWIVPLY